MSVKEFLCSFSVIEKDKQDAAFIYAFPYCDMDKEIMDVSELLMVTGFIAQKTIARTSCKSCKANLGSVDKPVNLFVEEEIGQYFDLINRGSLTYPSNLLFNVAQYAYLMFMSAYLQWNVYFWKYHTRNIHFWELLNNVLLIMKNAKKY